MVAARLVQHHHVEGRRGRAFLAVAAYVKALGARPAVQKLVNGARISVKSEDDVGVLGEELDEPSVVHAVRMLERRRQGHEIDDVHDPD